jgi:hypothetical protein
MAHSRAADPQPAALERPSRDSIFSSSRGNSMGLVS